MLVKNRTNIILFVTYVIRQLAISKEVVKKTVFELLNSWVKKSELGKEIFYTPEYLNRTGSGDCDDFVTLLAKKLHQDKIYFKVGFPIKNNAAFHVFILTKKGIIDPWISKNIITDTNYKKIYKCDSVVFYDVDLREVFI